MTQKRFWFKIAVFCILSLAILDDNLQIRLNVGENKDLTTIDVDYKKDKSILDTPYSSNSGSAIERTEGYYNDIFCSDNIWYKINLEIGSSLDVYIYFNDFIDLDLYLYNITVDNINQSISNWRTEHVEITYAPIAGYYYIEIESYYGSGTFDMYIQINKTTTQFNETYELLFESNNNLETGIFLEEGFYENLRCEDDDYFNISLDYDQSVDIYTYYLNSTTHYLSKFYSPYYSTSYSSPYHLDGRHSQDEIQNPHSPYNVSIKISSYDTPAYYNLVISIRNVSKYESKYGYSYDDIRAATYIYASSPNTLYCSEEKWIKIYLNEGDSLEVQISHNSDIDLDATLYAYYTSYLIDSSASSADTEYLTEESALYTGYYYIRVYSYSGSGSFVIVASVNGSDGDDPNENDPSGFSFGEFIGYIVIIFVGGYFVLVFLAIIKSILKRKPGSKRKKSPKKITYPDQPFRIKPAVTPKNTRTTHLSPKTQPIPNIHTAKSPIPQIKSKLNNQSNHKSSINRNIPQKVIVSTLKTYGNDLNQNITKKMELPSIETSIENITSHTGKGVLDINDEINTIQQPPFQYIHEKTIENSSIRKIRELSQSDHHKTYNKIKEKIGNLEKSYKNSKYLENLMIHIELSNQLSIFETDIYIKKLNDSKLDDMYELVLQLKIKLEEVREKIGNNYYENPEF